MLGQDCTNGNVYYYMRVVHLMCGFNQSHSIILLSIEWLLWQDCTNGKMYHYMRAVHLVCGFNQTHPFIILYLYVSRNGFDETSHMQIYMISF